MDPRTDATALSMIIIVTCLESGDTHLCSSLLTMSLTTLSPSRDRSWKGPLQANSDPLVPGIMGGAWAALAMRGKVTT